jgi:DNA-binding MarR family transcriptional regulator
MPTNKHEKDNLQLIEDIDRNIHAPARLKIMACLAVVEKADFTFLMRQTGLSRGNLSPNLRKLEEANYVIIQKEFIDRIPRTIIQLTKTGRSALETYKESMQSVLSELQGK